VVSNFNRLYVDIFLLRRRMQYSKQPNPHSPISSMTNSQPSSKSTIESSQHLGVRDWLRWRFLPLITVLAYRFSYSFFDIILFLFIKPIFFIGYPVQNGTTCCIRKHVHTNSVLRIAYQTIFRLRLI
jgi:hypothetical protein